MDQLDADILREMWRDQRLIWGGLDPRLSTTGIADRLGVDRTTVWARLKAWRQEGFLVRQEVIPNPALFGAGVAVGDLRVEDPQARPQALEALRLVDGILSGLDQVGPYTLLLYASESQAALERCRRLVGRLPSVDEVSMCVPFEPPANTLEPTGTDWRILSALRASPDAPLHEVANDAGVSRRTLTRRYSDLLDADAIWSFPVLDFTSYRGAVLARFMAVLPDADGATGFVNACKEGLSQMVWWDALEHVSSEVEMDQAWVDVYCHLASAAEVEEVQTWLLGRDGVQGVEVFFPKEWFVVSSWFDERVTKKLPDAAPGPA